MIVMSPLSDAPSGGGPTLGALLYADPSRARVSEAAWAALVTAIAARDARALQWMYQRIHEPVFTLAVRITRSRQSAEEVTVDVFHEVWRRAADYNPENGTVIGWIMNIARSRAIDCVRHEQRRKRVPDPASMEAAVPHFDRDVLEQQQQSARLRTAVQALSREERDAIELAYFADSTYASVAERLREPVGTIKSRIRSGLDKLRAALAVESAP